MEEQPQQQPTPQPEKPKKKFYKMWLGVILIVVIITGGIYYWFGYRVSEIRIDCNKQAKSAAIGLKNPNASGFMKAIKLQNDYLEEDYNRIYLECLRSYGLEK